MLAVVVGGHTRQELRVLVEPGAVVLVVKIRQTPLQLLELKTLVAAEAAAVLVVAQAQQEALV
jgi:3-polyprenyl-4-hydroxybenzoate decarboxylase